jgi:hypothetical protein
LLIGATPGAAAGAIGMPTPARIAVNVMALCNWEASVKAFLASSTNLGTSTAGITGEAPGSCPRARTPATLASSLLFADK